MVSGERCFTSAQELRAVHAGHHEVADDQLETALGQALQGFVATAGGHHLVVFLAEDAGQRLDDAHLVIDDEQAVFRRRQVRGRRLRRGGLAGEESRIVGHVRVGK